MQRRERTGTNIRTRSGSPRRSGAGGTAAGAIGFTIALLWLRWAPAQAAEQTASPLPGRWTEEQAWKWYDAQPWIAGANFVPSTASNEFEMWQEATFDPETIDRELGWAQSIGFNAMRVFLHDMLWSQDREGFFERIDQYLEIADRHGIRTIFVMFDSVWDPRPEPGPQKEPIPRVHNSRWVQSPHIDVLKDPARHIEVKPYLLDVLIHYRNDPRVLMWDLYNEPGNRNLPYQEFDPENKRELSAFFLREVFAWAREVNPSQPLTAAVWERMSGDPTTLEPIDHLMLNNSDVLTFHSYAPLKRLEKSVDWLRSYGRPLICTEYLSRTTSNTFQIILPYFRNEGIGAINWGLVSGRSQTIYPWISWAVHFKQEPKPWFHDVFRKDGTPYDAAETDLIRKLANRDTGKTKENPDANGE